MDAGTVPAPPPGHHLPVSTGMDNQDLDDAALWASVDTAVAEASPAVSRDDDPHRGKVLQPARPLKLPRVASHARKGACVALVARTEVALRAVVKTARELGAPDTLVVPADVTNVDDAKRAVEETVAHFGKRSMEKFILLLFMLPLFLTTMGGDRLAACQGEHGRRWICTCC